MTSARMAPLFVRSARGDDGSLVQRSGRTSRHQGWFPAHEMRKNGCVAVRLFFLVIALLAIAVVIFLIASSLIEAGGS